MTPELKSVYNLYKNEVEKYRRLHTRLTTTTGLHSCVIPMYNPIEAIRYLCDEGVDDDTASKLLFYETFLGFQFRSLGKLIKEEPKVRSFSITHHLIILMYTKMYECVLYKICR